MAGMRDGRECQLPPIAFTSPAQVSEGLQAAGLVQLGPERARAAISRAPTARHRCTAGSVLQGTASAGGRGMAGGRALYREGARFD